MVVSEVYAQDKPRIIYWYRWYRGTPLSTSRHRLSGCISKMRRHFDGLSLRLSFRLIYRLGIDGPERCAMWRTRGSPWGRFLFDEHHVLCCLLIVVRIWTKASILFKVVRVRSKNVRNRSSSRRRSVGGGKCCFQI